MWKMFWSCIHDYLARTHYHIEYAYMYLITWLRGFWWEMSSIFHSSGLNKAISDRRQVISCVTKASVCHHTLNANRLHRLWEIPANIGVKSNIKTYNHICRCILNMFYCKRIILNWFKHADVKGVKKRVTSAASLDVHWLRALWSDNSYH